MQIIDIGADGIVQPSISSEKIQMIKNKHYKIENTISNLMKEASNFISKERYFDASEVFKKLSKRNNNPYYVQQRALFLNKAKMFNDADKVIRELHPLNSMDTETTGIYGSTNKSLYEKTGNYKYLNIAIESYLRGFIIKKDYYNGGNVVNCLILKYLNQKDLSNDKKIALKTIIKKLNEDVLKSANKSIENSIDKGKEDKWAYSTAASASLLKGNIEDYEFNRDQFINKSIYKWEIETFNKTKELLNKYIEKS